MRRRAPAAPAARRPLRAFLALGVLGIALRLLLFWVNPPQNSFDNHFEPILWIMQYGSIPPKNALWQSYQPPVFYVLSAGVGVVVSYLGATMAVFLKSLQFVSCLFGILTLVVTYKILERVSLSNSARLVAFGCVCFLTRHIYQGAMHSNDTLSNFGVALCVWLMLEARERGFPPLRSALLGLAIVITLFTKYNAFVVLPVLAMLLVTVRPGGSGVTPRRLAAVWGLAFVIPVLVLAAYCVSNLRHYGHALPWNTAIFDPTKTQPRAPGGLSFFTFKPWEFIAMPILTPQNLDSFWTMLHGGMWFDTEPKFLPILDPDVSRWVAYYSWIRGEQPFPGVIGWTPLTHFSGSAMIALGLIPLALMLAGLARWAIKTARTRSAADIGLAIFPVLLLTNAAGIVYLTMRSPVFSSIKPTYLLNCLPAWAVLIGWGWEALEPHARSRRVAAIALVALFALVTLHVLMIVAARGFRMAWQV